MKIIINLFKYCILTLLLCIVCGIGFFYYEYKQVIPNYAISDTILSVRAHDNYVPINNICIV